jgi:hypothetical protein
MASTSAKHIERINQSSHKKAKKDIKCAEKTVNNSVDVTASANPSLDGEDNVFLSTN